MAHEQTDGPRALVINDGSLAAYVACLLEAERHSTAVWIPGEGSALVGEDWEPAAAVALVQGQGEQLGFTSVVQGRGPNVAGVAGSGLRALVELCEAAGSAIESCIERLVWPVACGSDVDGMFAASELAGLVTRVSGLGTFGGGWASKAGVVVDTPLIDLTTDQLVELLEDLGGVRDLCRMPAAVGL